MKLCKNCRLEKPFEAFYKLKGKQYKPEWNCRDSLCIPCRARYASERRKKFKAKAVALLGGKCLDCNMVHKCVDIYDFHHLDPSQKDFEISKTNKSFEKIAEELKKCVLLCAVCHRVRHACET